MSAQLFMRYICSNKFQWKFHNLHRPGVSSILGGAYGTRWFNIFQVCWFRNSMLHKLIRGPNDQKFRSKFAATLPNKNYFLFFFFCIIICVIKKCFLLRWNIVFNVILKEKGKFIKLVHLIHSKLAGILDCKQIS